MLEIAILNKLQNMQSPGAGSLTTEIIRETGVFRAKKTGLHYVSLVGSGAGGHPKFGGSSGAAILRFPVWLAMGDEVPVTVPPGGVGRVYPGMIGSQVPAILGGDGSMVRFLDGGTRFRVAQDGVLTTPGPALASTLNLPGTILRWTVGSKAYGNAPGTQMPWVDVETGTNGAMTLTGQTFGTLRPIGADSAGNIYAGSNSGFKVVKITPAGACSLLFGSGSTGTADGTGAAGTFSLSQIEAHQWAVGPDGSVYWLEGGKVRKCNPAGGVSTLAGGGTAGADGIGAVAGFNDPRAITLAADGALYVLEANGAVIRKVTTAGAVTTIATGMSPAISNGDRFFAVGSDLWMPSGMIGGQGDVGCRKVTTAGVVTTWSSDNSIQLAGVVGGTPVFVGRIGGGQEYAIHRVASPGAAKVLVGGVPGTGVVGMVDGGPGPIDGAPGAPASFGGYVSAPGGTATNGSAAPAAVPNAMGGAAITVDATFGTVHIPGVAGVGAASGTALSGLPMPVPPGQFVGGHGLFGPGGTKGMTPMGNGGGGGGGVSNVFTNEAKPPVQSNGSGAPALCVVEY